MRRIFSLRRERKVCPTLRWKYGSKRPLTEIRLMGGQVEESGYIQRRGIITSWCQIACGEVSVTYGQYRNMKAYGGIQRGIETSIFEHSTAAIRERRARVDLVASVPVYGVNVNDTKLKAHASTDPRSHPEQMPRSPCQDSDWRILAEKMGLTSIEMPATTILPSMVS